MLKLIKIQGFQSHVNTEITFAPNLTVITGATDSGKTAIIRAIRWLAFGEPGGEAFINKDVGQALVEVTLTDDTIIRKMRKSNKTSHAIINGQQVQSWESAAVPPEVAEKLGIIKQMFGDIEVAINFAYQLDAPFLLSLPASAGAKVLGKIAGTELVDLAVKAVSKDTYSMRQTISQAQKSIEKTDCQLGKYADLDTLKTMIDKCISRIGDYDSNNAKKEKLEQQRLSVKMRSQQISSLEAELVNFIMLDRAEELIKRAEVNATFLNDCIKLKNQYADNLRYFNQKESVLSLLKTVDEGKTLLDMLQQNAERHSTMLQHTQIFNRLEDARSKAQTILADTALLDKAAKLIPDLEKSNNRLQRILALAAKNMQIQKSIEILKKNIAAVNFDPAVHELLKSIAINYEALSKLVKIKPRASFINGQVAGNAKNCSITTDELSKAKKTLEILWAELDVCPLCEQPISKGDKNHGC